MDEPETRCCGKALEFVLKENLEPWQTYIPLEANCEFCESYFEKKPGENLAYKLLKDDKNYECADCGEEILFVKRSHIVYMKIYPLKRSDKNLHEFVPYCPNCEETPDIKGCPTISETLAL